MTPCADFFFRRGPPSEPRKGGVSPGGAMHMRRQSLTPAGRTDDCITSVIRKCSEVELDIIILWKVLYERLLKSFGRIHYHIHSEPVSGFQLSLHCVFVLLISSASWLICGFMSLALWVKYAIYCF